MATIKLERVCSECFSECVKKCNNYTDAEMKFPTKIESGKERDYNPIYRK